MVADAAVGAAGRAWRQLAVQVPAIDQTPADVQDWAVNHLGTVVGFAILTDLAQALRIAAHEQRIGLDAQRVLDAVLDLAQAQMLNAHKRSCLEGALTARPVTTTTSGG